jgi:hypothetical protein
MELGVLLHNGFGPDVNTGEVKKGYLPEDEEIFENWDDIKSLVKAEGHFDQIDQEAYRNYLNGSQNPALSPKQYFNPEGALVATQSNFFGGSPDHQEVA